MKRHSRRFVLGTGATALGLWIARPAHTLESGLRLPAKRVPQAGVAPRPTAAATAGPVETFDVPVTAPPPWMALAPFSPGEEIAESWTLQDLSGVQGGSAVLTLSHGSGRQAQLRVMRRGVVPIGVAQTAGLDLLLMNHARGGEPTDESLARVIRGFAAVIDDHHKARPAPRRVLAQLEAPPSHYC